MKKIKKFICEMPKEDRNFNVILALVFMVLGAGCAVIFRAACGFAIWQCVCVGVGIWLLGWGYDLFCLWSLFTCDLENNRPRTSQAAYFDPKCFGWGL